MGEQVTVRIIRTMEEIESIRTTWACWKTHLHADVDFYIGHECALPGFVRPHIMVLYRGGQPDAMLVGKLLANRSSDFAIGSWSFFKPHVRLLRIPSGSLLGNPSKENCAIFLRELMSSLNRREADLVAFWGLRLDSPMYDLASRSANFLARDPFPEVSSHCAVNLPHSIEAFLRELSPKVRYNLKRQARQLEREYLGDVTTYCFRESSELERMFQDVEEVARKTWQRGLGGGFRDDEGMRRRYGLAARSGWLRTYVLYVAGKPRAFWTGTLYGGTYNLDFTGYDPAVAKYSPGTCLLMKAFDDLCKNNVKQVDYASGDQEYKERFGDCKWEEAAVHIYSPGPKGIGLKVLRALARTAYVLVKGALKQAGLLKRVRRVRRHLVTPRQFAVSTSPVLRTKPSRLRGGETPTHVGKGV
jgi:hypothetical protein